jgi:hypothetical protein
MKPLFEKYIPNLKLGFFMREYALAKREYADRIAAGEVTLDQLARNGHSVDRQPLRRDELRQPVLG